VYHPMSLKESGTHPAQTANAALLDQVIAAYGTDSARWNTVVRCLLRHVTDSRTKLNCGRTSGGRRFDFLTRTGRACIGPRQEFILLSDAIGLSSAVDNLSNASSRGATESAMAGPSMHLIRRTSRMAGASHSLEKVKVS
jgi:hypothetical protein